MAGFFVISLFEKYMYCGKFVRAWF